METITEDTLERGSAPARKNSNRSLGLSQQPMTQALQLSKQQTLAERSGEPVFGENLCIQEYKINGGNNGALAEYRRSDGGV